MIAEVEARATLQALRARGWMAATAESCTGGLISAALTDIAGSSDVVERGFVTYSNAAKTDLLRVDPAAIDAEGAVSEIVARQMAEGALSNSHADIAVSVTGIAGPGRSESKPEGRVCFGLARRGAETATETRDFGPIGRERVRMETLRHALSLLRVAALVES